MKNVIITSQKIVLNLNNFLLKTILCKKPNLNYVDVCVYYKQSSEQLLKYIMKHFLNNLYTT